VEEAPMVDLAQEASLGIRRSVPVSQLPRELQEPLAPQSRSCWFFEAGEDLDPVSEPGELAQAQTH